MEVVTKEKCYDVYVHINKINNKMYVGQTCQNPKNRWRNGDGYKGCTLFYNAIQKYGWDNFEHIVVLSNLSLEDANYFEEILIKKLDTTNKDKGYNLRSGGENSRISDETKRKMSKSQKGKIMSIESRLKMKEHHWDCSGENNPNYGKRGVDSHHYGKHLSDETRKKISDANKDKYVSEETRQKISKANKGRKSHRLGKHLSEEHKKNLRKSHTGMSGANNPSARKVLCIETGEIYSTIKEASNKMCISSSSICSCCRGNRKTAGGFHWKYYDD